MKDAKVVVVGGGVVGLSVAFALSDHRLQVTLFDRGNLGAEASWAGAGIISPGSSRGLDDPSIALRTESARLHREWSRDLLELTAIDNGYRQCGGLDLVLHAADATRLSRLANLWQEQGIAFERLTAQELKAFEPALGLINREDQPAAYHLPGRAQIRNPWHLRALIEACRLRKVLLHPRQPVTGFEVHGDRVCAVRTSKGSTPCDHVVLAAGAWTGNLLKTGLGHHLPTPPVKGQILLFNCRQPLLRRIVEHGPRYLVPRGDGRILAGATEELTGFDSTPTQQGRDDLLAVAFRLCPALSEAKIERSWAGLRPGSIDSLPYIGPLESRPNVLIAAGHRRQGLQLSPGTAAAIADLIVGRPCRIPLDHFRPNRDPNQATPAPAFHS